MSDHSVPQGCQSGTFHQVQAKHTAILSISLPTLYVEVPDSSSSNRVGEKAVVANSCPRRGRCCSGNVLLHSKGLHPRIPHGLTTPMKAIGRDALLTEPTWQTACGVMTSSNHWANLLHFTLKSILKTHCLESNLLSGPPGFYYFGNDRIKFGPKGWFWKGSSFQSLNLFP